MSEADFIRVLGEAEHIIRERIGGQRHVEILEAGGGSTTYLQLPDARITTVDISAEQLERNTYAHRKICADLQQADLGTDEYDIVVCFDVLEHLPHPEKAVANLLRAVRPGGLVYIACPNPSSLSGLITKFSPHWFHVLVYRHVFRYLEAGRPGHPPFPTFMRPAMYFRNLRQAARAAEMREVYFSLYERDNRDNLRQRSRVLGAVFDAVLWAGASILGPQFSCSDFILLLQKPELPGETRADRDPPGAETRARQLDPVR